MGNILQNSLDVTYEDFLKGVFGVKAKPEWNALKTLFSEIVVGKSTLVSDMSKPLREDSSKPERKRAQERVSGWLGNYDFVGETGGWLLKNIPEDRLDGCTFAVDFSDISKVFGGEGMEGMAMGRDGSTGEIRMGHDFICVSLVGADYPEALPVYVKLGRGRKGHDELIREAIKAVMERTGGKGWIVEDRGMDGAEHLWTLKRDDRRAVVRVNKMDRDVFGDGLHIDASLQSAKFFDAMLHVHTGDRRVKIRCKPGVVQYCKDPRSKDAVTEDVGVLVVESRFDDELVVPLPPPAELHVDGQRLGIVRADERDADEVVPHADLARRAVAPHRHALHALAAEDLADVREVDRERAAVEPVLGYVLQQPPSRRLDEVVVPEPSGDALLDTLAFRLRRILPERPRQDLWLCARVSPAPANPLSSLTYPPPKAPRRGWLQGVHSPSLRSRRSLRTMQCGVPPAVPL